MSTPAILSFLVAFGAASHDIDSIFQATERSSNNEAEAMKTLKKWLSSPMTRMRYNRITALQSYNELDKDAKRIADWLFKEQRFGWVRERFGLSTPVANSDVVRLKQLLSGYEFSLPSALRDELLAVLKKYQ